MIAVRVPFLLFSFVVCGALGQEAEAEEVDPVEALGEVIPGVPGEDYPIYATPPDTSFSCDGYIRGYYADPEAECQTTPSTPRPPTPASPATATSRATTP